MAGLLRSAVLIISRGLQFVDEWSGQEIVELFRHYAGTS
jgi:hypothetical protein